MATFNRNDGTFAAISSADVNSSTFVFSVGGLVGSIAVGTGISTTGGILNITGGGDVIGPATNTANNVPQWNGANSKTLKDGLAVGTASNNIVQLNASAQLPAVDGSLLTGVQPVPTSSTFPVNLFALMVNHTGTTVNNNSTVSGASLRSARFSAGTILDGGTQTGTWRNVAGSTVADGDVGYFVRTV